MKQYVVELTMMRNENGTQKILGVNRRLQMADKTQALTYYGELNDTLKTQLQEIQEAKDGQVFNALSLKETDGLDAISLAVKLYADREA